jgi:lipoate-protein ligase A
MRSPTHADVSTGGGPTVAGTSVPGIRGPWRLVFTPPASGPLNMALDELLMHEAVRLESWILRVYGWAEPTVSFGRNQTAIGKYSAATMRERSVTAVRRPTGGRAILHHREATYSVTAPLDLAGGMRESYGLINRLLVAGLARLGVRAVVAAAARREIAPGVIPCFDHPSAGELVVGSRKLVGSAQWRSGSAMLQHGSILIDDDQSMLPSLMEGPSAPESFSPITPRHVMPSVATLREVLGYAPPLEAVAAALFATVQERCTDSRAHAVDTALLEAAQPFLARYSSDGWTWRR